MKRLTIIYALVDNDNKTFVIRNRNSEDFNKKFQEVLSLAISGEYSENIDHINATLRLNDFKEKENNIIKSINDFKEKDKECKWIKDNITKLEEERDEVKRRLIKTYSLKQSNKNEQLINQAIEYILNNNEYDKEYNI